MSDENTMSQEAAEIHYLLRNTMTLEEGVLEMNKNAIDRQQAINAASAFLHRDQQRDREHWVAYAAAVLPESLKQNSPGGMWRDTHEWRSRATNNARSIADAMLEAEKQRWEDAS